MAHPAGADRAVDVDRAVLVGPVRVDAEGHRERDRVAAGVHGDVGDQRLAEEGQQLLAVAAAALAQPGDPGALGR